MNRILLYEVEREVAQSTRFRVHGVRANHLATTLHAAVGMSFKVGLLDGPLGRGTVIETAADSTLLEVEFEADPVTRPQIDLVVALPRPKALKRLLPQIAAFGVDRLCLVNAARVEKPYFSTQYLEPAHYEPLLDEGLMQGAHTQRPRIQIERRFRPFVEDHLDEFCGEALRFVGDPGTEPRVPPAIGEARVVIAIGPDTGFVPFERDLLAARGFQPLRFAQSTLRVDTACIAALAAIDVLRRLRGNPVP